MAINRATKVVLKALSYPDISIEKHYHLIRFFHKITMPNFRRPFYRIWDHEVHAGDHSIPVRLYMPKITGNFPVLIFFHGGGWVTGNIDSYDKICRTMAALTGHLVVSVDYRLAPEFRFPAATEDCYMVTREIYLQSHLLGVAPEDITLIGDSAGANLAAAVSLMARDRGEFLPQRQILIYPAFANDHTDASPYPSIHELGKDYLITNKRIQDFLTLYRSCEEDLTNPYYAPLEAKDFSRQPQSMIITAAYDPLRDEGEDYGKKLQEAGNTVEIHRIQDALHGFFTLGEHYSHVKESYRYINKFLKSR